jgi:hypothetical protein
MSFQTIGPDWSGKLFLPPSGHFRHPDEKSSGHPPWAFDSVSLAGNMAYRTCETKRNLAPQ